MYSAHTHSTPLYPLTATPSFMFFFFNIPVSRLLEAAESALSFSLSLLFSPLLSLANKISGAQIYSQASWTFLWVPWSPVSSSSFHFSLHPLPPKNERGSTPFLVQPRNHNFTLSRLFLFFNLLGHFVSSNFIWFALERNTTEWFSFWKQWKTQPQIPVQLPACGF